MVHAHSRTLLADLGFADKDKKEPLHDLACRYMVTEEALSKYAVPEGWVYYNSTHQLEAPIIKGQAQYAKHIGFLDAWLGCSYIATCERKYTPSRERDPDLQHQSDCPVAERFFKAHETYIYKIRCTLTEFGPLSEKREQGTWRSAYYAGVDCDCLQTLDTNPGWMPSICQSRVDILLEVKIHPVPVGDILRQLGLYRMYPRQRLHLPSIESDPEFDQVHHDRGSSNLLDYMQRCSVDWDSSEIRGFPLEGPGASVVVATAYDLTPGDVQALSHEGVRHVRLGKGFDAYVAGEHSAAPAPSLSL